MKHAIFSKLDVLLVVCVTSQFVAGGLTASGSVFGAQQEAKAEAKPAGTVLTYEVDRETTRGGEPDMKKVLAAVNRRVNPGWFRHVTVRLAEGNRIEIVVPSTDPAAVRRAERLVERIGTIEFRILATIFRPQYRSYIERAKTMPENQMELRDDQGNLLAWWVPVAKGKDKSFDQPDIATRKASRRNPQSGKPEDALEVLVVKDQFDVNGTYLTCATAAESMGRPCVNLRFNNAGAQRFGRLTGSHLPDAEQNVKYLLGIILNGYLHSAPFIKSAIFDSAEITGDFTKDEVQEVVDVLNAGLLPVGLRKVQPPGEPKQRKADG
jgi:preprotein translocase subunit SecD